MVRAGDEVSELQARVPYKLIPTSMPGVFMTPAPPPGFDPLSATAEDLLTYGLPLRPATGNPSVTRAWERAVSSPKKRIIPELIPQIGKTHHLRGRKKVADASYISASWSGSVIQGNWTFAQGNWNIPTVTQPGEPQGTEGGWNSSSWIGLDGVGSNDVLQAGVQQRVNAAGNASYVAWYEWYAPPQNGSPPYIYQTNISNFNVSPGNNVYCEISYINGAGRVYLNDTDVRGDEFSITLAPPPGASFNGSSAEWIMEAPDGGEPTSSLPRFTQINFYDGYCHDPNNIYKRAGDGDTYNIVGFNATLTAVTLTRNSGYVAIGYNGP